MTTLPIQIAGQTGGNRSAQFGGELTQNMYIAEVEGRVGVHDFPGLKTWVTLPGADRGWHVMAGELYKLISGTMTKIRGSGVEVQATGVVTGTDRAIFADDGNSIYFTADKKLWRLRDNAVTEVIQTVVVNPGSIAYINRKFIITGSNSVFAVSDVGDGDSWNALNFAEAEVDPDPLLRVYSFNQLLYMLGSESTEIWYDTGAGNPPLNRRDSSLMQVGIAGKHAIANTDNRLYWLGNDKEVYQCVGSSIQVVSTPAVAHTIEGITTLFDCICSNIVIEGQHFILFTFPTDRVSLLFAEAGYWVTLGSGTDNPTDRWLANAMIKCYGDNLASGQDGSVYIMDLNTYTDDGNARLRIRDLQNFTGAMIKVPNNQIEVQQMKINAEVGVGLTEGQGVDPVLMCQFSPDGGKTWQGEQLAELGVNGEYGVPVYFYDFCVGYNVRARIKCSDPVYVSLFDGTVDVQDGGY